MTNVALENHVIFMGKLMKSHHGDVSRLIGKGQDAPEPSQKKNIARRSILPSGRLSKVTLV